MALLILRMDKVFAEFCAPLFWHGNTLLGLEVKGYHRRATLCEALVATHYALV
jgi:hypothetical protein